MHGSKESNLELVESTDEFVQQCHGFQQFDQTMKAVMLSNMREEFDMNLLAKSSTSRTNVHIYDFRLVTGDVYLDLDSTQRDNKNDPLIINLVARQFVTFNLFNLPSDLSNVTILLSGECNLEVRSKQEWLKLNVAHAPVYDEISGDDNYESTAQPNQAAHASHRTKWMSYLSRQLGIETRYYVEHLTMLCHVRHLFIGSSHNSVLVQYSDWNYEDSSITEYLLIKKCVRKQKLPASASTSTPTPSRIGDEPIKDEFYLFEFDSNQKEKIYDNETIRIYLKDCAFNKRYNLIVLFNLNSQKLPRMILDTDICRLNILYVSYFVLIAPKNNVNSFEFVVKCGHNRRVWCQMVQCFKAKRIQRLCGRLAWIKQLLSVEASRLRGRHRTSLQHGRSDRQNDQNHSRLLQSARIAVIRRREPPTQIQQLHDQQHINQVSTGR